MKAWKRVVEIFNGAGSDNVSWVWSPDPRGYPEVGWNSFSNYCPGDAYVDWLRLTIANFGYGRTAWDSFERIAQPTISNILEAYPDKPLMIAELACAERGGDKAAWITDALDAIRSTPRIHAVVLFSRVQERDWRIDSSSSSLAAYTAAISDSHFVGRIADEDSTTP